MKIQVVRKNQNVLFEAKNPEGNTVLMEGADSIGGEGKGVRPMQMLLMALGGCSGIDIALILKKQKQVADTFEMEIDGEREQGVEPSLYQNIHVRFKFTGKLDHEKTVRAVDLSMEKYCSVSKTLEKSATITWSVEINNQLVQILK